MPIFVETNYCHICKNNVPSPTKRYRIPLGYDQCKFCVKWFCPRCRVTKERKLVVNLIDKSCDFCKEIPRV